MLFIFLGGEWEDFQSVGCYAVLAQKVLFQIEIFHRAGLENGVWFITTARSFRLCLLFQVKVSSWERLWEEGGACEEHSIPRAFPLAGPGICR